MTVDHVLHRLDAIEQRIAEGQSRAAERADRFEARLDELVVQTTLTNGRVTGLERWRAQILGVARGATGGVRVVCIGVATTVLASTVTATVITHI